MLRVNSDCEKLKNDRDNNESGYQLSTQTPMRVYRDKGLLSDALWKAVCGDCDSMGRLKLELSKVSPGAENRRYSVFEILYIYPSLVLEQHYFSNLPFDLTSVSDAFKERIMSMSTMTIFQRALLMVYLEEKKGKPHLRSLAAVIASAFVAFYSPDKDKNIKILANQLEELFPDGESLLTRYNGSTDLHNTLIMKIFNNQTFCNVGISRGEPREFLLIKIILEACKPQDICEATLLGLDEPGYPNLLAVSIMAGAETAFQTILSRVRSASSVSDVLSSLNQEFRLSEFTASFPNPGESIYDWAYFSRNTTIMSTILRYCPISFDQGKALIEKALSNHAFKSLKCLLMHGFRDSSSRKMLFSSIEPQPINIIRRYSMDERVIFFSSILSADKNLLSILRNVFYGDTLHPTYIEHDEIGPLLNEFKRLYLSDRNRLSFFSPLRSRSFVEEIEKKYPENAIKQWEAILDHAKQDDNNRTAKVLSNVALVYFTQRKCIIDNPPSFKNTDFSDDLFNRCGISAAYAANAGFPRK